MQNEWFSEHDHGLGVQVQLKSHLFSHKSQYQQIDVYDTELGKMLVLDDIIQLTEFDEFCYQEMMAHIPLFAHPAPERVLVIGGGDGGVLREVAKHDCVKVIDICEIDQVVIDVAKKYIPSMACGYDDPRVTVHVTDGSKFVRERQKYYDVIIVDSTDPIGPGEILFGEQFYRSMKSALRAGGIIGSQSESIFLHPTIVTRLISTSQKLFKLCDYAIMFVPTYPSGNIGTCVASLGPRIDIPARTPSAELQAKLNYYSSAVHEAAFKLPEFGRKLIDKAKNMNNNS
jgi:spermidine synthase